MHACPVVVLHFTDRGRTCSFCHEIVLSVRNIIILGWQLCSSLREEEMALLVECLKIALRSGRVIVAVAIEEM